METGGNGRTIVRQTDNATLLKRTNEIKPASRPVFDVTNIVTC